MPPSVVLLAPHPGCSSLDSSQLANAAEVAAQSLDRHNVSVVSDSCCLLPYRTSVTESSTHIGSVACALGQRLESHYLFDESPPATGDVDHARPRLTVAALCAEVSTAFTDATCKAVEGRTGGTVCVACPTSELARRVVSRLVDQGCTVSGGIEVGGVAARSVSTNLKPADMKGGKPSKDVPTFEADAIPVDPTLALMSLCGLSKGSSLCITGAPVSFPPESIAGLARSVAAVVKQVQLPGVSWSQRIAVEATAVSNKKVKGGASARGAAPARSSEQVQPSVEAPPAANDLSSKLVAVQTHLYLSSTAEVLVASSIERYLHAVVSACIHYFESALSGQQTSGPTAARTARFAALTQMQAACANVARQSSSLGGPPPGGEDKPPSTKGSRPLSQTLTAGRGPSVFEDPSVIDANASQGQQFVNSITRMQHAVITSTSKGDVSGVVDEFIVKTTAERNAIYSLLAEVGVVIGQLRTHRRDLVIAHYYPQLAAQTAPVAKGKVAEKGPYLRGSQVVAALGALVTSLSDVCPASSHQDRLVGGLLSGACGALVEFIPLASTKLEAAGMASTQSQVSQGKHQQQHAAAVSQLVSQATAAAEAYTSSIERYYDTQSALFGRVPSAPVLPKIPTPSIVSELLPLHMGLFFNKHRPLRRSLGAIQQIIYQLDSTLQGVRPTGINHGLRLLSPLPMSRHTISGELVLQDSSHLRSSSVARSNNDGDLEVIAEASDVPGGLAVVQVSVPASRRSADELVSNGIGMALGWIGRRPSPAIHSDSLPYTNITRVYSPSMRLSGGMSTHRCLQSMDTAVAIAGARTTRDERLGTPGDDVDEGSRFLLELVDVESNNLRRISRGLARARLGDREQVRRATLAPGSDVHLPTISKRRSLDTAAKPSSRKGAGRVVATPTEVLTPAEHEAALRVGNEFREREEFLRVANAEEPLPRAGTLLYERRPDVEARHASETVKLRAKLRIPRRNLSKAVVGAFFDETFGVATPASNDAPNGLVEEGAPDALELHQRHRDRVKDVCSALSVDDVEAHTHRQRHVLDLLSHPLVPVRDEDSGIVGLLTEYVRNGGTGGDTSAVETKQVIQTVDSSGEPLHIPAAGASDKVLSLVNNTLTPTEQQYLLDQVALEQLVRSGFKTLTPRFSTFCHTIHENHRFVEVDGGGGFLPPPEVVDRVSTLRALFPNNLKVLSAGDAVPGILCAGHFPTNAARYSRNSLLDETVGYLAVGLSHLSDAADGDVDASRHPLAAGLQSNEKHRRSAWRCTWGTSSAPPPSSHSEGWLLTANDHIKYLPPLSTGGGVQLAMTEDMSLVGINEVPQEPSTLDAAQQLLPSTVEWHPDARRRLAPRTPQTGTRELVFPYDGSVVEVCKEGAAASSVKWMKDDIIAVHHLEASSPRSVVRFGGSTGMGAPLVTVDSTQEGSRRVTVIDSNHVSSGMTSPIFAAASPVAGPCIATTIQAPTGPLASTASEISFTTLPLASPPSEVSRYLSALGAFWQAHPEAPSLADQHSVLKALLYAQSVEYQQEVSREDALPVVVSTANKPQSPQSAPRQPGKPPVAAPPAKATVRPSEPDTAAAIAETLDLQRLVRHVQHRRQSRDGSLVHAATAMNALLGLVIPSVAADRPFNPLPPSVSHFQPILQSLGSSNPVGIHTLTGYGPVFQRSADGASLHRGDVISVLDLESGRRVCCTTGTITVDFHSKSTLKLFPDGTTATHLRSVGEHSPSFLTLSLAPNAGLTAPDLLGMSVDEVLDALEDATIPNVTPMEEWLTRTAATDDLGDALRWIDKERAGELAFPPGCMRVQPLEVDDHHLDVSSKKNGQSKKKGPRPTSGDKSVPRVESEPSEPPKTWADELLAPLLVGGQYGPIPLAELPTYWLFVAPDGTRVARRGKCVFDECSKNDAVLWRLLCVHANRIFPKHVALDGLPTMTSTDAQNVCVVTSREDGCITAMYKGAPTRTPQAGVVAGSVRVVVCRDGTVISSVLPLDSNALLPPSSDLLVAIPIGRPALVGFARFLSDCSVDIDEATPSERNIGLSRSEEGVSLTTLTVVVEHPQFPRVLLRRHGSDKQPPFATTPTDAAAHDVFVSYRNGSVLSSQLSVPVTANPLRVVVGNSNNNPATSVAANNISYGGSTNAGVPSPPPSSGGNLRITTFRHTTGSGLHILPTHTAVAALLLEPWSVALSPSAASHHLWMPASELVLKGLPGVVGGLLLTGGASARSKASAAIGIPAALYEGIGIIALPEQSSQLVPAFRLVDRRNYLTAVCRGPSGPCTTVFKRFVTEGLVHRMVPAGHHGHPARKSGNQGRGTSLSPFRNASMASVSRTDQRDGMDVIGNALEQLEATLRHFAHLYIRLNQLVGSPQVTYFTRPLRDADLQDAPVQEGNEGTSHQDRAMSPTSMTQDSSSVRGLHRGGAPTGKGPVVARNSTEELGYLRYDFCPMVFAVRKGGSAGYPVPILSQLLSFNDILPEMGASTNADGDRDLFDAVAGALGVEGSGKRIGTTIITSRTSVAGEPNVEQLHFFEAIRNIPGISGLPSPPFASGPTPVSLWLPKSMLPPKRLLAAYQALADSTLSTTQSSVKRQLLLFRSYDSSVRDTLAAILLYDAAKRRSMRDYAESVLATEVHSPKSAVSNSLLSEKYRAQLDAVTRGVNPSKVPLLAAVDGRLSVMTDAVEQEIAMLGGGGEQEEDGEAYEYEGEEPPTHQSRPAVSQREAAVVYLNEKTKRPTCREVFECVPSAMVDFGEICIPVYDDALTEAETRQQEAFRQQQGSSLLKSTGGASAKARRFDLQMPTNHVYGFRYRKTIKLRNRTEGTVLAAIRNPALKFDIRGERTIQGPVRVMEGTNIRLGPKGDASVTIELDTSNDLLGHRLAQSVEAIAQTLQDQPTDMDAPPKRYALTLQEVVRVCVVGGVEPMPITVSATIILNRSAKDSTVIHPDVRMLPP